MRIGRSLLLALIASVLLGPSFYARALENPTCTVTTFERSASTALAACNALLGGASLDTPTRVHGLKVRGRALHRLNEVDGAIADFDRALELAPNDPELHVRRGWTHNQRGELDLAARRVEQALALDASHWPGYVLAGVIMQRSGRLTAALKAYEHAVSLQPNEPLPRLRRLELLRDTGRQPEALREADAILALPAATITKPAEITLQYGRTSFRIFVGFQRAWLLWGMGRPADAERALDRGVELDPVPLTLTWRAEFHLRRNAPDSVIVPDLERALAMDPNDWSAHDLLARVHFYAKRYEEAAAEFSRAITSAPQMGKLRWWRSMALRKLGRIEEATTDALAALDVDPEFLSGKSAVLIKLGYLQKPSPVHGAAHAAMQDAVRACMLDERCW